MYDNCFALLSVKSFGLWIWRLCMWAWLTIWNKPCTWFPYQTLMHSIVVFSCCCSDGIVALISGGSETCLPYIEPRSWWLSGIATCHSVCTHCHLYCWNISLTVWSDSNYHHHNGNQVSTCIYFKVTYKYIHNCDEHLPIVMVMMGALYILQEASWARCL